jgi:hypothetical protein
MKKILFPFLLGIVTLGLPAAEQIKSNQKLTLEQRKILQLQKTGGIISQKGKGKVLILNCQDKFNQEDIISIIKPFKELLKVEFEIRKGEWKFGDKESSDANLTLYVINDVTLPISLIAPESRWGVVNASKINDIKNFSKAVTRAGILTFGAGVSQYKISPMQPVHSLDDLNNLFGNTLTVDVTISMKANMEKAGITQSRLTTYRKACLEGWAPAQTNEYQKAIWDKVHAAPKNPMKIEFDPKKGR